MSYEILLSCGSDRPEDRARRRATVGRAAGLVPGATSSRIAETPTATCALVATEPAGGTLAEFREDASGSFVAVATTAHGLAVAATSDGQLAGAEAGHVGVHLRTDGTVSAGTDGMAFLPAYWAESDSGGLLLSTHLASLVSLGLPNRVDERGLLEYLVMLHPLQERTLLAGAGLLAPGTHLEWSQADGGHRKGMPLFQPSAESMSDDEAVAAFAEVWREVVADVLGRNAGARLALGLSGGLDSRAIAVMATELGARPVSYTYGNGRNREAVVAARVAERLGLPHVQVPVTDDRLLRQAPRIADRLDGAHSPAEMYELWFDDLLPTFADVIVNGLAGGPIWGDDKGLGITDPTQAAERQWHRYQGSVAAMAPYLSDDVRGEAPAVIRDGLAESMAGWDFSQRGDAVIFWKLANRQLRWGNILVNALRRSGLRIEAPFLDSRVLRFASRLTTDQRRNGTLYLQAHRELFAATANIGRSDDGNSPHGLTHVYWSGDSSFLGQLSALGRRHPVSAGRRAARFALQTGAGHLRQRTGLARPADVIDRRASVFPADLWARTRPVYAQRLATFLEAAPPSPLLSESAIARAAAELRAGRSPSDPLLLAKVATANHWLADYATRAAAVNGAG
ncbi:asparagine synthetase B family protein [Jiangella sp. DSM 45060]|uniref:asparagine synthase-related protein n=1 Tax=Jiangella sp. DSM 45060 TaxID=1798224 RepID=UPI00087D3239|nr:asparagine synthetase B family protein [Jiangella sp. DSM 45060]SDT58851.1 asparagine synthase (glutamine-hydrolysing) [Jiangella sp. DSM 45060]